MKACAMKLSPLEHHGLDYSTSDGARRGPLDGAAANSIRLPRISRVEP